jgi:hypothetical protein
MATGTGLPTTPLKTHVENTAAQRTAMGARPLDEDEDAADSSPLTSAKKAKKREIWPPLAAQAGFPLASAMARQRVSS